MAAAALSFRLHYFLCQGHPTLCAGSHIRATEQARVRGAGVRHALASHCVAGCTATRAPLLSSVHCQFQLQACSTQKSTTANQPWCTATEGSKQRTNPGAQQPRAGHPEITSPETGSWGARHASLRRWPRHGQTTSPGTVCTRCSISWPRGAQTHGKSAGAPHHVATP